ncbi:MAG: HAD-IB family hydrolase [Calditrichaeota bacterium]|nr:MAG: HAD-IB family hydrolase [Calditrichota bacterium]
MRNKNYIAFFDLDRTILNTNSGKIIGLAAVKHGIITHSKFIEGTLYTLGNKLGLIKGDEVMPRLTRWLKGHPEQPIVDFARQIFNQVIKHAIRKEAIREIEMHRRNRAQLVMLSASTSFICRPVMEFLGLDDLICTDLQVVNSRFSGNPVGDFCFGRQKLLRSLNFVENQRERLQDAYFYTDSHTDLPMLEAVGHPMCVSPDRKLASEARRRGWQICRW